VDWGRRLRGYRGTSSSYVLARALPGFLCGDNGGSIAQPVRLAAPCCLSANGLPIDPLTVGLPDDLVVLLDHPPEQLRAMLTALYRFQNCFGISVLPRHAQTLAARNANGPKKRDHETVRLAPWETQERRWRDTRETDRRRQGKAYGPMHRWCFWYIDKKITSTLANPHS
jgi:hypothetical protein